MTDHIEQPGTPDDTEVLPSAAPAAASATAPTTGPSATGASTAVPTTGPTAVIDTDAPDSRFTPPADPAASVADSVYAASAASAASAAAAPAAPAASAASAAPAPRPTIRWGALVWALVFGGTAALTLWILVDPSRRAEATAWMVELSPLAASLYALIGVGVVVALFGLVGLIRRGERARTRAARDAGAAPTDAATAVRPPVHHGARRA
ncbi:hypothetical protein [Agromyces sp. NPDC058110]|uniref:hypothetical protein n=1 Tax=Agromyces sp. NPDC058110 TaxID=3346345 RepID=UPI0036D8304A